MTIDYNDYKYKESFGEMPNEMLKEAPPFSVIFCSNRLHQPSFEHFLGTKYAEINVFKHVLSTF